MNLIKTLIRKLAIWLFIRTTRPREIERKLKIIGYSGAKAKPATNDFIGILYLLLNE